MRPPRIEIYGAARPEGDRRANEDAFLIIREKIMAAGLCDGAGNAEGSAKKVLALFHKLIRSASGEEVERLSTWNTWVGLLDASLSGGNESTFVAVAATKEAYVGVCVGDSRIYQHTMDGRINILTSGAAKGRLGSGRIKPAFIYEAFEDTRTLLLMSDGAWGPLDLYRLGKLLAKSTSSHLSDLPSAILAEASRHGRADDMTVVVMQGR